MLSVMCEVKPAATKAPLGAMIGVVNVPETEPRSM
jgi:hypothetical protein